MTENTLRGIADGLVVALLDWIGRTYDRLRPGGKAIVGNFSVANPNKTRSWTILDWKLLDRTMQNLIALFEESKFGSAGPRAGVM